MNPEDVTEAKWQAWARKVRRRNRWRAIQRFTGYVMLALLALVLIALAVIVCFAREIEVVI